MLLATWSEGLPLILPALAALTLFGGMLWALGNLFARASTGWRVFIALAMLALLALSLLAVLFGLLGIAAVQCAPDAYECPL